MTFAPPAIVPVTINTGNSTDVFPGARLVWMHVPRGGYGFATPVDATVISVVRYGRARELRVRIAIRTKDHRRVQRIVDAKHLQWSRSGAKP